MTTPTPPQPNTGDERLRESIAAICKLHGVPEATYWNIADETLAVFKAELGAAIGQDDRDYSNDNADEVSLKILVATATACNELRAELRYHFGIGDVS